MKTINKIWVIIDILMLIPLLTVLLAMPDMSIVWLRQGADALAAYVMALSPMGRPIMAAVAVGLDLLLLAMLYFELRRPPTTHARVKQVDGAVVEIAFEAIRQRLLYHLGNVPDVLKVTSHINARGGRVDVQVDVETSPHVIVPDKATEIIGAIHQALEDEMGLKMRRKPEVRIYHSAYHDVGPVRPRSSSRPGPSAPPDSTPALPDSDRGESPADSTDPSSR
jgi:hypothetical protein